MVKDLRYLPVTAELFGVGSRVFFLLDSIDSSPGRPQNGYKL
jgi:hypothetical protein